MVICRINGGLGNQMFQYSAGFVLSKRLNTQLKLDITDFNKNHKREFQLDIFNIKIDTIDRSKIKITNNLFTSFIGNLINNKEIVNYIKEPFFHYWEGFQKLTGNIYLEGYWQSYRYFQHEKDKIKSIFNKDISDCYYNEVICKILSRESVAVHIRRGDYVNDSLVNTKHGFCGIDYYVKAMKLIKSKVNNAEFFFFSDDMNWVYNVFGNDSGYHFISKLKNDHPYTDMHLMSLCKHNIIANSSFSWWSAWLNNNEEKIVISPKRWFKDKSLDTKDIIPSNWIRI